MDLCAWAGVVKDEGGPWGWMDKREEEKLPSQEMVRLAY